MVNQRFIVDTSVWIDFFRGSLRPEILKNLCEGISLRLTVITDIIRHEIKVGAKNKKDYQNLTQLLRPLDCLSLTAADQEEFDQFAWTLSQKGLRGRYTDASIAFLCNKHCLPLLSFDLYFQKLAEKGLIKSCSF